MRMPKNNNTKASNSEDPEFKALVASIADIIRRPSLATINAKQAYKILYQFREQYLTEAERALGAAAKQELWTQRVVTLGLSGHDARIDEAIAVLSVPARQYALRQIPATQPAASVLDDRGVIVLTTLWEMIDHAKQHGDATAQQMAQYLHQAIYAVLPPENLRKVTTTTKDRAA